MMPIGISLLFILTITGMTFVPESTVPILVWPLLLGLGNLALVLIRGLRHRALLDEDVAPLLTSVFSLTLAVVIPFEHPRRGVSFIIAFIAMFLAGVIWSVWRAMVSH